MTVFERIESLRKLRNISQGKLEKELGFSNGSISKWKTSMPNPERLQKLADYFEVTIEFLMTGKEESKGKETKLTTRDEKDISNILKQTEKQLMNAEGLMFDGQPASPEAVQSLLDAMRLGVELAKKRNKEKYTPKKYRK